MDRILHFHDRIAGWIERHLDPVLPLMCRAVFAAVLLVYFWTSAMTKPGDGPFGIFMPGAGAYAQIFPRVTEAVLYDVSQMSSWHWAVVTAGTLAEFVLPLLIVIGLATRLAASGMIGFVVVQSLTDLYGHGGIAHAETLGAWFDRVPDATILDQRAFWILLLGVLVVKGAGLLSVDGLLRRRVVAPAPA